MISLDLLSQNVGGKALCSEIVVVVGHNAQSVMDYVGDMYNEVPVKYVFQAERKGIAHAVKVAKETLNDDFILCLADEILFNPKMFEMVETFYAHKADCVCGAVIDGTDFSMKPIAYSIDEQGQVTAVTEKPQAYDNDIRGIGECIFAKSTLEYLDTLQPNKLRGEYEMRDWIRMIVDAGKKVEVFELADGYCNINYAKDIKSAEERMGVLQGIDDPSVIIN